MIRYTANRILQSVPTMLGITILSFFLMHIVPGGPATVMLGDKATPQLIAQINRSLGLDKPIYVQYGIWLLQLLQGNLGYAYSYHQSVTSLIGLNLPRTLLLVVSAILISHLLAILIAVIQAARKESKMDYAITVVTYFLYAMPTFWLGVILISIFAIGLNWLPSGGIANPLNPNPGFSSYVQHMILPAMVLILGTIPGWSRYLRSSMIETMLQDYIRTAHAKGLSKSKVLIRHVLRNSLLSLVTLIGLSLPGLFSGALIIEMIFNYPGMGLLFWTAAQNRDYPILLGIVTLVGILTIVGNLLSDLMYGWLDPRIKYQ